MDVDVMQMMRNTKALATGHFVYKALHNHGAGYIDKDMFPIMGARKLVMLLEAVADNALNSGLDFGQHQAAVLLAPAYGAIKYCLSLAAHIERLTNVRIVVVETELERDASGKRFHIIPDNVKKRILGLPVLCEEDIVNAGTTIREVNELIRRELATSLYAALSIVDRGNQTAETLNIPAYYPYVRINMDQHDVRTGPCPLCAEGVPINTDLGKGEGWVKMFGQPPYPNGMDFSAFWAKKE